MGATSEPSFAQNGTVRVDLQQGAANGTAQPPATQQTSDLDVEYVGAAKELLGENGQQRDDDVATNNGEHQYVHESSRLYMEDNFAAGRVTNKDHFSFAMANPPGRTMTHLTGDPKQQAADVQLMHQGTTALNARSTYGGGGALNGTPGVTQVNVGAPMPKWPANWTSAAFEAVAVKKSYILSPPEIYAEMTHHGHEKSKFAWYKLTLLTIIAGCYVGFGFTTCLQVGGTMVENPSNPDKSQVNLGVFKALFGAFGFPFGFTTIVVCGAELYTSLCAYGAAAWLEGKIPWYQWLKLLVVSWCGNFAGCAAFMGLVYWAGIFDGKEAYMVYLAQDKVHHTWGQVFAKGILANWLVGIATWMANAAQDLTGKFIGIWLPISAFAAIGLEHCIANQYLLPLAILYGAEINAEEFIW